MNARIKSLRNKYSFILFDEADRPYVLIIPAVLIIVYCLYIFIPFGAPDDYFGIWDYILNPQGFGIGQLRSNIISGRLTSGIIGLFLLLFIKPTSISHLGLYRLVNLVFLIPLSLLLYSFLRKQIPKCSAFSISIIICTLPSFSMIFYFAGLIGAIVGGVLAGFSVWLLTRFQSIKDLGGKSIFNLLLSCLLLFAAAQSYQPTAMFYWVFVAIVLAFDRQINLSLFLNKFLFYTAIFCLSMGISLIVIRLAPSITGFVPNPRATLLEFRHVIEKIDWFIKIPLNFSSNFFLLPQIPQKVTLLSIIFIIFGLFWWFGGSIANRLCRIIFILTLVPLSYFPNLVVEENGASFRSMIALSSMWVILIYLGAGGVGRLLNRWIKMVSNLGKFGMVFWASTAILLSMYNSVMYIIIPTFMEHRIIHSEISKMSPEPGDTVYVLMPNYSDSISPFIHWGEFGFPATATTWGGRTLVYLIFREIGVPPGQITVTTTDDLDKVPINQPGTHVLNLHKMNKFELSSIYYPIERIKIFFTNLLLRVLK